MSDDEKPPSPPPLGASSFTDLAWKQQAADHREAMSVLTPMKAFDDAFASVVNVPDDELRRATRARLESLFDAPPPMEGITWALDRYMARLSSAVQIPALMLLGRNGSIIDTREITTREIDAERFTRVVLRKQFRMAARRWFVLRGPLTRFLRAP